MDDYQLPKTPRQKTVRAFIEARVGAFGGDLATAEDLCVTLRSAMGLAPDICFAEDMERFRPRDLRAIMDRFLIPEYTVSDGKETRKLFILRNRIQYLRMDARQLLAHHDGV